MKTRILSLSAATAALFLVSCDNSSKELEAKLDQLEKKSAEVDKQRQQLE